MTLYNRCECMLSSNPTENANTLTLPMNTTCCGAMEDGARYGRFLSFSTPIPCKYLQKNRLSSSFRAPLKCSIVDANLNSALLRWKTRVQDLERLTRPGSVPVSQQRYEGLPETVKGASQMLGRLSPGCEGTRGVFPKCNFSCTPCYHSASANKVPIDGKHTMVEVARQMDLLHKQRGPIAHTQLIGGEVSLLPAKEHAEILDIMRFYNRIPMSFTHGDFDYDYLVALATEEHRVGTTTTSTRRRRRFKRLDFACHFDSGMVGRRGIIRANNEGELNAYRRNFTEMFQRLRREYGVKYYLAHNMTVGANNLDEVSDVVREISQYGFRMLSFQPSAAQGMRQANGVPGGMEAVWKEIEKGAGTRLPHSLFQMGHKKCNRVCLCLSFNNSITVPLFEDTCPGDTHLRDIIVEKFGNIVLPTGQLALKITRFILRRPQVIIYALLWILRVFQRCGGLRMVWQVIHRRQLPRLITFVVHAFMDAAQVKPAWKLIEQGHTGESETVKKEGELVVETVERLLACSYGMARVDENRIVPACVQHSVYDEHDNQMLIRQLRK